MSGIAAAACCCGGGIPSGNTECVPIVGNLYPQFNITASTAGWVRGNPIGEFDETSCVTSSCVEGETEYDVYCTRRGYKGWDNSIGQFQGKLVRDNWYVTTVENCGCCDITEDTVNYVGGSWNATLQFGAGLNQVNVLAQGNTFNYFGTVTASKVLCAALGSCNCYPGCGIGAGLYDIVSVSFGGTNLSNDFYLYQRTDDCRPDTDIPSNYQHSWTITACYYKPVPMTPTRMLTGVYTRYGALVSVPRNFYYTTNCGGPYSYLQYLHYPGPYPPKEWCYCDHGGTPANPSECICGTANAYGFTIPPTITLV